MYNYAVRPPTFRPTRGAVAPRRQGHDTAQRAPGFPRPYRPIGTAPRRAPLLPTPAYIAPASSPAGFSLLELLVTIALSAVLALVAVPRLSQLRQTHELLSTATQLGMEITRVRMQAIGQNAPVRLKLLNATHYRRERLDQDTGTWEAVGSISTLPKSVKVEAGASGAPSFDPNGLAAASTTLRVVSSAGVKTLTTNVLGEVTIS